MDRRDPRRPLHSFLDFPFSDFEFCAGVFRPFPKPAPSHPLVPSGDRHMCPNAALRGTSSSTSPSSRGTSAASASMRRPTCRGSSSPQAGPGRAQRECTRRSTLFPSLCIWPAQRHQYSVFLLALVCFCFPPNFAALLFFFIFIYFILDIFIFFCGRCPRCAPPLLPAPRLPVPLPPPRALAPGDGPRTAQHAAALDGQAHAEAPGAHRRLARAVSAPGRGPPDPPTAACPAPPLDPDRPERVSHPPSPPPPTPPQPQRWADALGPVPPECMFWHSSSPTFCSLPLSLEICGKAGQGKVRQSEEVREPAAVIFGLRTNLFYQIF